MLLLWYFLGFSILGFVVSFVGWVAIVDGASIIRLRSNFKRRQLFLQEHGYTPAMTIQGLEDSLVIDKGKNKILLFGGLTGYVHLLDFSDILSWYYEGSDYRTSGSAYLVGSFVHYIPGKMVKGKYFLVLKTSRIEKPIYRIAVDGQNTAEIATASLAAAINAR